jgi:hypothetical protein
LAFALPVLLTVLVMPLAAVGVEIEVRDDSINGRVFDSSSGQGVPRLSVHLIATKALKLPVKITTTGSDGSFGFAQLPKGKYLLLIYRGPSSLVFRREIDTTVTTRFTVPLRRVRESR